MSSSLGLGVCTRSTERCLDSFERMLSMQIAKETDILLTIIGLLPLAPMFRRSLDQRRVPESRLQHWQAFLEFASAAARRRAHAKPGGRAWAKLEKPEPVVPDFRVSFAHIN